MDEEPSQQILAGIHALRDSASAGQPTVEAIAVIRQADTGAEPLLMATDDGQQYWCKCVGNPHGDRSLVAEWVVAELARLIHGPVPPCSLVSVDAELVSDRRFRDGSRMPGGVWFGSRVVAGVEFEQLDFIRRDGNPERIPFYLALWHWCLGDDEQFLREPSADDRLWSFDHGMWLDNAEPPGDRPTDLMTFVKDRWPEPTWASVKRCDAPSLLRAAQAILDVTPHDLGAVVGGTPVDWGFHESEQVELARFLYARRTVAADHLRSLVTALGGS